jgi:hypothetical protein
LRPRIERAPSLRQIRLVAGLVVFTYVTLHFVNHSLGNISVEAMENGLAIQKWLWQSLPGAITLYSVLTIHMVLGLWALYQRRDFRWTRMEAIQLVFGLSIPFLLADHVIGTRVSLSLFGTEKGYAEVLLKFWVRSPISGALQAALLLIVWIHGCIGVLSWLRLKPFYPRARDALLSFAVMLPGLALLGYYQAGRRILQLAEDPLQACTHLGPDVDVQQAAIEVDAATKMARYYAAKIGELPKLDNAGGGSWGSLSKGNRVEAVKKALFELLKGIFIQDAPVIATAFANAAVDAASTRWTLRERKSG